MGRVKPYYQDALVTLYHGDCREVTAWGGADVMLTDPPYGIAWKKSLNKAAGSRAHAGIANDGDTSMRDWALMTWGKKPAFVFGSIYAPFPKDVRHILVWEKPGDAGIVGSTIGVRRDVEVVFMTGQWPKMPPRHGSVIRSRMPMVGGQHSPAGRTGHPHSKPIDLLCQLIDRGPSGVISDPFAGSGSTLVAAKSCGVRSVGVELDEAYCEIIAMRLDQGSLLFGGAA